MTNIDTNFMQAGETIACGHCEPEKYQPVEPCPCKCHSIDTKGWAKDWDDEVSRLCSEWSNFHGGDVADLKWLSGRLKTMKGVVSHLLSTDRTQLAEKVKHMKKPLPKGPCLNAESHMFGTCFTCERIRGGNQAIDEVLAIINEPI